VDSIQIKADLKRAGYTMTGLAKELGCEPQTVQQIINGDRKSKRIATVVAEKIGKPIAEVFPGKYETRDV
jgi:lambda repressor-like predicted transcriptional regulator